jgi:hypothetical protein
MVKLSLCIEVPKEGGDYIHMFGHICVSTAQYKLRYFTQRLQNFSVKYSNSINPDTAL